MNTNIFKDIVKVEVTGRNVDNYIKKILKSRIRIIKLKKINYKRIYLYISYADYLKLKELRTIYEIKLVEKLGFFRIKRFIKRNIILFILIILGLTFLYMLSNIVFDIKVIHSNPNIKKLVYEELDNNGIKKYRFKKNYKELQNIKNKILNENKDKIEWLEIIESGTKYIVRLEQRIKNDDKKDETYQNIIASKNAVLTKVIAIEGEKIKFENDYVNKGDIIITGNVLKPDNSSILMHASGVVYGEVWYTIEVEYPYIYKEENITGKTKNVIVLNFLNKRLSLFDFNKYKTFKENKKILFSNNILPINLSLENQKELNIIDEFLTEEEAVDKAIDKAKNELINNNKKIEKVKNIKIINKDYLTSKVKLKLFISVVEDIGMPQKIDVNKLEENNKIKE